MPNPSVASDLRQPADVHLDLSPEITFNPVLALENLSKSSHVRLAKFADPGIRLDTGLLQDLLAGG